MKRLIPILLVSFGVAVFFCIMWGCFEQSASARGLTSTTDTGHGVVMKTVYDSGSDHAVVIIEFEGHKYIGLHKGGITHCRSCPCGVKD